IFLPRLCIPSTSLHRVRPPCLSVGTSTEELLPWGADILPQTSQPNVVIHSTLRVDPQRGCLANGCLTIAVVHQLIILVLVPYQDRAEVYQYFGTRLCDQVRDGRQNRPAITIHLLWFLLLQRLHQRSNYSSLDSLVLFFRYGRVLPSSVRVSRSTMASTASRPASLPGFFFIHWCTPSSQREHSHMP